VFCIPSLSFSDHAHGFHVVIQRLCVQASTSPVLPSALIALNKLMNCIVYEAVEEALQVCMCLSMACPRPDATWAMLSSLLRLAACCSSHLSTTILALLHLITSLLLSLRTGAIGLGAFWSAFHCCRCLIASFPLLQVPDCYRYLPL
jgi:hypothetical protein